MSSLSQDRNGSYIVKSCKIRKANGRKKIGTNEIYEGTSETYEGTSETYEGTNEIYEGTNETYEGTNETYEGTNETYEGTNETCRDTDSICKSCVCELLNQIANKRGIDPITGCEKKILIMNKATSQPISVDGMDPTIFTLESFDPETCCAIFSFDRELMDSTTGSFPVQGTLIEDCHSISGIFFIEDTNESW